MKGALDYAMEDSEEMKGLEQNSNNDEKDETEAQLLGEYGQDYQGNFFRVFMSFIAFNLYVIDWHF